VRGGGGRGAGSSSKGREGGREGGRDVPCGWWCIWWFIIFSLAGPAIVLVTWPCLNWCHTETVADFIICLFGLLPPLLPTPAEEGEEEDEVVIG